MKDVIFMTAAVLTASFLIIGMLYLGHQKGVSAPEGTLALAIETPEERYASARP